MGLFKKRIKDQAEQNVGEEFLKMAYEMKKMNSDVEKDPDEAVSTEIESLEIDYSSKTDRLRFIKSYCEQIIEASKNNEEAKIEYQAVTSYLTDIQRIDVIDGKDQEELYDAARNIVTLSRERTDYQNRKDIRITDSQMKYFEKNESQILEDIKNLKEYEAYNSKVKNDMRHLEGEKGVLRHQLKEFVAGQKYLKNISIITVILVVTMFALFYVIDTVMDRDMQIPYLLTVALAGISSLYIMLEGRKNTYNTKLTQIKLNRAITLLNTVKIKYVNSANCVDYAYRKHAVNSALELQYQWEQYCKAKTLQKELLRNTENTRGYQITLTDILQKYEVNDPDIWTYQAAAIFDSKEKVEIRHRLNVRRQKLRERIEYNTDIKEKGFAELEKLVEKVPDAKGEVANVLLEYKISI
jgi:hypothetical protein